MGRTKARERGLPPFSLPITPCSRRARYAKTTGDESAPETIARLASLADFFFAHAELFLAKTTVSPRSLPLER